ncbi:MAG TPA: hypothetical protein H9733_00430 [Candidatus Anaerotignum merdipullorum]|nr:hypothetical protein [Candidatus Anaerotignum merdipullorum]
MAEEESRYRRETGRLPTARSKGEQVTMFRGGTSQVQILSPQLRKHHAGVWCFFCCFDLRPTGFRGCIGDRCQWQKKRADTGEKQGDCRQRAAKESRRRCFEVGHRRFQSCLGN